MGWRGFAQRKQYCPGRREGWRSFRAHVSPHVSAKASFKRWGYNLSHVLCIDTLFSHRHNHRDRWPPGQTSSPLRCTDWRGLAEKRGEGPRGARHPCRSLRDITAAWWTPVLAVFSTSLPYIKQCVLVETGRGKPLVLDSFEVDTGFDSMHHEKTA